MSILYYIGYIELGKKQFHWKIWPKFYGTFIATDGRIVVNYTAILLQPMLIVVQQSFSHF